MKMTLYITAQFLALISTSQNSLIYKGFSIHPCSKKALKGIGPDKRPSNYGSTSPDACLQGIMNKLENMSSIPYHAVGLGLAHPLGSHATIKNKI
ncbi:MAG TPA: hypothetical protein PK431_08285 [Chitinophagales bacterium]|jgi:hypothetical protein|nr:hypothetical protein [Chitinophagales bacterium]